MGENKDDFEFWLAHITDSFARLSPDQQKLTFTHLMSAVGHEQPNDESNTSQAQENLDQTYHVLRSVMDVLHIDMLSNLPIEINEMICSNLSGKSLLSACRVSWNWNRASIGLRLARKNLFVKEGSQKPEISYCIRNYKIISSLNKIWQNKCLLNGFQNIVANGWKRKYIEGQRILEEIQTGQTLLQKVFKLPEECNETSVSSLFMCDGFLFVSAGKCVCIWQMSLPVKEEPMVCFKAASRITSMCAYRPRRLLCGHVSGSVSVWVWGADGTAKKIKVFVAHTNSVTCVSVCKQLGILASGGWDHIVKVWCLHSLCLLHQTIRSERISQVSIIQTHCLHISDHEGFALMIQSVNQMTLDDFSIRSRKVEKRCGFCAVRMVAHTGASTYTSSCKNENTWISHPSPSCHVVLENLVYMKNCGKDCEMVFYNFHTRQEKINRLQGQYHLLAIGQTYALLLKDVGIPSYCFLLVNHRKNYRSASSNLAQPMRLCNQQIVTACGHNLWLDDLGHLIDGQALLSFFDSHHRCIVLAFYVATKKKQQQQLGVGPLVM